MSSEDDSSGKDAHGDGNCSGGRGLDDNGRISDLEFIGTSDSPRVDSDTTPGSRDASNPMKRGKLAAGENGVSMERPAASTALLHLSAAPECDTRTCGIEHLVKQRSAEWFQIRRRCVLGASQFGDAVGAGRGRPIHFLQSLRQQSFLRAPDATPATQHGIDSEPMIGEMYHLLSGNRPEQCGVFTPPPGDVMHNLIAATPDGKIMWAGQIVGLVEFKAPYYKMYSPQDNPTHGIPRNHLCQMMGQMGVSGVRTWCDYVVVSTREKFVCIRRVHYCHKFWLALKSALLRFLLAFKYGIDEEGLAKVSLADWQLPEEDIHVEDRCSYDQLHRTFTGDRKVPLTWTILAGELASTEKPLKATGTET